MTIGFDPRNVVKYGGGAAGVEVCMTQDANQYKMAKCIVQEIEDGDDLLRSEHAALTEHL